MSAKKIRLDAPSSPASKSLLDVQKRKLVFKQTNHVIDVPRRRESQTIGSHRMYLTDCDRAC